ncbi:hypothetical protein [Snodgrassella sp. CFCC 13594]|uniref:hypothetical protein n=1 Tax=Snodgrassella sp. CFCC 13594 TaxID=1775559 RepID=UPI00082B30E4|nr:hypothetical protein [Snodgrassella sp. CFCC 13594]
MATKPRKTVKSENLTIRLDPQTRFLAEMASRVQKRSLSSFVEWSVQESFSFITWRNASGELTSLNDLLNNVWHVDESERFIRMALSNPELLTFNEQLIIDSIKTEFRNIFFNKPQKHFDYSNINRVKLRELWPQLNQAIIDGDFTIHDNLLNMDKIASAANTEREGYQSLMRDLLEAKKNKGMDEVYKIIKTCLHEYEIETRPL